MSRSWPAALLLLLALLPHPAALAAAPTTQPAPSGTPDETATLRRWFAELASPDPAVREQARVNLMGMRRRQLESFQKLVQQSRPLLPSQQAVLREIVTHVYLAGERYEAIENKGFIGISMDPFVPRVVVTSREPGFPGYAALQNGDVILRIAERPDVAFQDSQSFGDVVKEFGPGRRIHLEVLRAGKVVRVALILAARPAEAENALPAALKNFSALRRASADEYWEKAFAPLLRERVG